jgi:hypothetical protein
MTPQNIGPSPPRRRRDSPQKMSCLAADGGPICSQPDATNQAPPSAAVAAAIADLTIDASVEAAHIASVTARHFAEQVEIGDLFAAEHSLAVAVRHLREAIVQICRMAGPRQGDAAMNLVEDFRSRAGVSAEQAEKWRRLAAVPLDERARRLVFIFPCPRWPLFVAAERWL